MISLRIQVRWMDGFQRRPGGLNGGWREGIAEEEGEPLWRINIPVCLLMHLSALATMQIRPGFLPRTACSVSQPLPPGSPSARWLTADEASSSSSSPALPFVDDEMTARWRFASQLHFSGDSPGSCCESPVLIGG